MDNHSVVRTMATHPTDPSPGGASAVPCPVCDGPMTRRKAWLYACPQCRFLKADLPPGGGADVEGLDALRRENFEVVLDRLEPLVRVDKPRLLDVGCARGMFLDAARRRGIAGRGIEPDADAAAAAARAGHDVRVGFFPEAVEPGARVDIISFNDTFEHLPDPAAAVDVCRRLLEPGGILILNLPNSGGIFYRTAAGLDRLGLSFPLERLWQVHLSSPHLGYFNPQNLTRMAERHGFAEVGRGRLKTVRVAGLWARLRAGPSPPLPVAGALYLGVAVLAPLLRLLPRDIILHFYRKR